VKYRVVLPKEAGFIEAQIMNTLGGSEGAISRLTWAGHEFLDASRSNAVWEGAKSVALKATGTITLEAIKMAIPVVMRNLIAGV
jgi:hypothetical protein